MGAMTRVLKRMHAYCLDNNININRLMNIIVRSSSEGDELLGKVDYKTLDVTFDSPIDSDIVFDVFVNRAMFDNLAIDMLNDTFYATPTAMSKMTIQIYDSQAQTLSEQDVRVYYLTPDESWETTEIEKSLRVKTPYGIGYIGLVPENHVRASNLKICLGKNTYGNDIIRCFEKA